MPRDATGNYTLPTGNPVITGTTITSTWANTSLSDIATALTDSVWKAGDTSFAQGKGTHTWSTNPGGATSSIGPGNGDGWGLVTNNLKIGSWFGVGIAPLAGGGTVPVGQYAWSCNARTGETTQAGTLSTNQSLVAQQSIIGYAGAVLRNSSSLYFQTSSNAAIAAISPYTTGIGVVNAAGNAWTLTVDDAGNVTARLNLIGNFVRALYGVRVEGNGIPIAGIQGGYQVWNEGNSAGLSGHTTFINNQGGGNGGFMWRNINTPNTVQTGMCWMEGNGNFHSSASLIGSNVWAGAAQFASDGNINGSTWGGWLSNYLARYIQGNSQIQWASGIAEGAGVSVGGGGFGTSTLGAPWVQAGIRTNGSGNTLIYPQNVWLRT
jgi:hypothetical protein